MIRVPDGTLRVLVQGIRRMRLERRVLEEPYLLGEFVERPDVLAESREVEALTRNVQSLFARDHRPRPVPAGGAADRGRERRRPERALPSRRVDAAAEDRRRSRSCSSIVDVEERLREVSLILNRELEVFELGTQDPVAGAVGAREGPARVLPAPADEGDPGGARRGRSRAGRDRRSCASGSRRCNCPRRWRRPPSASCHGSSGCRRRGRVRRHPHVPRLDRDAPVGRHHRRTTSISPTRARSSTRTTTTWRR